MACPRLHSKGVMKSEWEQESGPLLLHLQHYSRHSRWILSVSDMKSHWKPGIGMLGISHPHCHRPVRFPPHFLQILQRSLWTSVFSDLFVFLTTSNTFSFLTMGYGVGSGPKEGHGTLSGWLLSRAHTGWKAHEELTQSPACWARWLHVWAVGGLVHVLGPTLLFPSQVCSLVHSMSNPTDLQWSPLGLKSAGFDFYCLQRTLTDTTYSIDLTYQSY